MHLVSIVIPCYNDYKFVEKAILSAYNQTYSEKEIIVVDDGSNFKTKMKLKSLRNYINVLLVQDNKGQSAARNFGIKKAKSGFIFVLDSDDFIEPTFIEKAMEFIVNPQVKIVTSLSKCFTKSREWYYLPKGGSLKNFLFGNAAMGSVMFKKKDWQLVNGYDEKMTQGWEDWEFYIRLLKSGGICHVMEECLFHYQKREGSTTSKANSHRGQLFSYIFIKHKEIYINNYSDLIKFLTTRIDELEQDKNKILEKKELKIGKILLSPFRSLRKIFQSK